MQLRSSSSPLRDTSTAVLALALLTSIGCSSERSLDPVAGEPSRAFGIWSPGPDDTCTKEQHDAHATVGPDGKSYPTWHSATGPGGCTFGHEHGRDPSGSNLYDDADGLPFGFANEMRAIADPANPRDEDHVGHKVEWENDVPLLAVNGSSAGATVRCSVLTKLHQGTHSKDAFTNNLHELVYHVRCEDRTEMHVTMLAAIGRPGHFRRSCDRGVFVVAEGTPVPANSPIGEGSRTIPDRVCIDEHLLVPEGRQSNYDGALHEIWETWNTIFRADGSELAFFDPYFHVYLPSRFHDPGATGILGRPMDACYELTVGERARGGYCDLATAGGTAAGIAFDSPRSPFNGVSRALTVNANRVSNAAGPEVWYTDALGQGARQTEFEGSIRQRFSVGASTVGFSIGPTVGGGRDYTGAGVRPPN
jgi:hypothetical protein